MAGHRVKALSCIESFLNSAMGSELDVSTKNHYFAHTFIISEKDCIGAILQYNILYLCHPLNIMRSFMLFLTKHITKSLSAVSIDEIIQG